MDFKKLMCKTKKIIAVFFNKERRDTYLRLGKRNRNSKLGFVYTEKLQGRCDDWK